MNLRSSLRTLAFASVCALPLPAGVLTINFTETGGNVVVTASGSLADSSAWTPLGGGVNSLPSQIVPSFGAMTFTGPAGSGVPYLATGVLSGNLTLGFGTGNLTTTTSYSGHTLGFIGDTSLDPSLPGLPLLILPNGYSFSSPTNLSSTMTFTGTNIAGLGITTGSYVFNNGGDTIQLTFGGGGGSSVPDAGPGPALALLLGGLGLRQWRSSRRSRAAA
jgi:hypothetical protein